MSENTKPQVSASITDKLINYLFDQARIRGFSVVLLLIAVGFLYRQSLQLSQEWRNCNSQMIEMYREDRQLLQEVINNNTRALEKLNYVIRE